MKAPSTVWIALILASLLLALVSSNHYDIEDLYYEEYDDEIINPSMDNDSLTYSFNAGSSNMFAKLSSAAYCISHKIANVNSWKCPMCKKSGVSLQSTTAYTISSTGIGFYIGYSAAHKRIYVVFRGSSNIANWMANLDFGKVGFPCSGCQVHKGFLKVYQSARPSMVSKVNALLNKFKGSTVSITGHSLGGAIAKLAILDAHQGLFKLTELGGILHVESTEVGMNTGLSALPFSDDEIKSLGGQQLTVKFPLAKPFYTFGAPRIGNPQFASYFRAAVGATSLFRVTHHQDPVPKLPPMGWGFAHSTQEVYYPNAGQNMSHTVCSSSNGDDPKCIHKTGTKANFDAHRQYGGIWMTQGAGDC